MGRVAGKQFMLFVLDEQGQHAFQHIDELFPLVGVGQDRFRAADRQ